MSKPSLTVISTLHHSSCLSYNNPSIHFFFFKQKTAYEMRISDWSSDVCSSDLLYPPRVEVDISDLADQMTIIADGSIIMQRALADPTILERQALLHQIGRASCRGKSVSVRVDLGGRRIIKKKKNTRQ